MLGELGHRTDAAMWLHWSEEGAGEGEALGQAHLLTSWLQRGFWVLLWSHRRGLRRG